MSAPPEAEVNSSLAIERPPFPPVWDSTIRSAWAKCQGYWNYAYLMHMRKPESGIHLHFGAVLAKGLEVTRKSFHVEGLDASDALRDGSAMILTMWGDPSEHEAHDKKNIGNCLLAHAAYFEQYPLALDAVQPLRVAGKAMIECSAALPIPGCYHPETGEPILYAGRFDMLGHFANAAFVVDEKTASALGTNWRNNWRLRSQFTGYTWLAREWGVDVQGAIIRGIGILKERITFEQAIVSRPQWMIDRWIATLQQDVANAIEAWRANKFLLNLDNACSEYGGCPYLDLCESQYPERWFENYEIKPWDPLKVSEEA